MAEPLAFGNGNELGDLNYLTSGDESEDENHRDDEIKQLLADFITETFDEGSEHSFTVSEHSKMQDRTSNESSIHSYNGNSDQSNIGKAENSGFSFLNNGHTTVLPNINERPQQFANGVIMANSLERIPNQLVPKEMDNALNGGENGSPAQIEESNETVSLIHKTHCPQLTNGGGGGDTNGNDDNWTSTPVNKMEQLQTLNSYRERQIARSEETIASLTKDKRALNHQIGLMRTEMIEMQSSYTDVEKAMKLKEEEVEFLKSKIQEAIVDYEILKRAEKDTRSENNRLMSQIGRLEQEVKLLSTIGSSSQQAEVDTIVRQIRDRHAQEIISFKTEVANLEAELRSYKRHCNEPKGSGSISTQTVEVEAENVINQGNHPTPTRTNCTQTFFSGPEMAEMINKIMVRTESCSTQTEGPKVYSAATQVQPLSARLTSIFTQTEALPCPNEKAKVMLDSPKPTEVAATQTLSPGSAENSTQTVPNCAQSSAQTIPQTSEKSASMNSSSTAEVQTNETLQTYEVLNSLFEKWATEVSEATKRAELAESQVQFTEVSLKKLRKKFKALYNMTSVCRKEWKKQEEFLKDRNEEIKSRYLNTLINLHQKFDVVSFE